MNTLYIIRASWQGPLEYWTTNAAEAWSFCLIMGPSIGAHVHEEIPTNEEIPHLVAREISYIEQYWRLKEEIDKTWKQIKSILKQASTN